MPIQNKALTVSDLAFYQLLTGAVLAGIGVYFESVQLGASIAIGASLMLFNVIILGWSWHRLLAKKSIAWTVGIIVIKYAVLLGSIVYLARLDWFRPIGAGIGIASFILAALVLAVRSKILEEKLL